MRLRAAALAFFLAACATQPPTQPASAHATLADLDWIGGCWESTDHTQFERWLRPEGLERRGFGARLENGETTFREVLRLEQSSGGVIYWAAPEGQEPVGFQLAAFADTWARFENFEHDYPKTIRYQRDDGALRAWIGDGETERQVLDVRLSGCD